MIAPEEIPQFVGNFESLDTDIKKLKKAGGGLSDAGGDVHSSFQGLSSCYTAPEAEQLFATTGPVKAAADDLGDDITTVATALSTYAATARPLAKRLTSLRARAIAFNASIQGDDDWDADKGTWNTYAGIRDEIRQTVQAFQDAETACYDRVVGLVGGVGLQASDGRGKPGTNSYGFTDEVWDKAEEFPWETKEGFDHPWYVDVGHGVRDFVKGFVIDGGWATLKGLGTLAQFGLTPESRQAWKGISQLATFAVPGGIITVYAASKWGPEPVKKWAKESLTTAKETGKALVAWDMWSENPSRAAGNLSFNVLTAVTTRGAGTGVSAAGKAGTAAKVAGAAGKAAGVAGKIGRIVDPTTYVIKGVGAAGKFSTAKIADIVASMRTHSGIEVPPRVPPNAIPDPVIPGRYLDPETLKTYDANDSVVARDGTAAAGPAEAAAKREPSGAEFGSQATKAAEAAQTPGRQPALVGAGERVGGAAARAGDDLTPRASHEVPNGGSGQAIGGQAPTAPVGTARSGHGAHNSLAPARAGAASTTHSPAPGVADGPSTPPRESVSGDGQGSPPSRTGSGAPGGPEHRYPGASTTEHTHPESNSSEPRPGDEAHGDSGQGHDGTTGHPGSSHSGDASNGGAVQEPDFSRRALPPGRSELSLAEVRRMRGEGRWQAGERLHREMYGGGTERHYPVPTREEGRYPVTQPGGRKVDVPVDMPDGRTLAVEVKTYKGFRTLTLHDGTKQVVKGEVPLSGHIKEQIHKDLALREMDPTYDPRWVFTDAGPSAALRKYLMEAKIIFVEYGPAKK
ncbi:hypothetical protein [Streptomyces boninensis]|uniref:hypothetical protein n=1 Tax=Streptomyces boninensis TaxID=2039455 RepID=UPI003B21CF99